MKSFDYSNRQKAVKILSKLIDDNKNILKYINTKFLEEISTKNDNTKDALLPLFEETHRKLLSMIKTKPLISKYINGNYDDILYEIFNCLSKKCISVCGLTETQYGVFIHLSVPKNIYNKSLEFELIIINQDKIRLILYSDIKYFKNRLMNLLNNIFIGSNIKNID